MICSVLMTCSGSSGHAARHRSATCCAMLSALPVTVANRTSAGDRDDGTDA
jgi:hypothetical protein